MAAGIPSMLAQFVSVLYSIVDRMYIGNIPEIGEGRPLAGVGVCGPNCNPGSFLCFSRRRLEVLLL